MSIRRIVTSHDQNRGAVVVQDEQLAGFELMAAPGSRFTNIFGIDQIDTIPSALPTHGPSYFPPAGGVRCTIVELPGDAVTASAAPPADTDPAEMEQMMAAAFADAEEKAPGLLATFDQAEMPFHTSDTIDLVIILKGELVLDLGADEQRKVTEGDVIIQNGTRHAWHNPGDQPAAMAAISLGATRT